jgi:heme O synthase-like polyprenyltransferase
MKSKILLTASAALMGILGIALTFMPDEILAATQSPPSLPVTLLLQAAGALYVGFAFTNWMSRGAIMGGIYARPLAMGNLLHFFAGSMALVKHIGDFEAFSLLANTLTVIYVAFTVWFGITVFTHPLKNKEGAVA